VTAFTINSHGLFVTHNRMDTVTLLWLIMLVVEFCDCNVLNVKRKLD
jgi:hypothetical protein